MGCAALQRAVSPHLLERVTLEQGVTRGEGGGHKRSMFQAQGSSAYSRRGRGGGGGARQGIRARVPFFRVLLVSRIPDAFIVPELQMGEGRCSWAWGLPDPSSSCPPPTPHTVTARAQLETSLKCRNYERKFQLLLHLEELQMEHDIRHYDLESVPMNLDSISQNPKLLMLEVGAWIGGGDGGSAHWLQAECCSCRLGKTRGRMKMFLPTPPPEGSTGGSVGILCPERGSEQGSGELCHSCHQLCGLHSLDLHALI